MTALTDTLSAIDDALAPVCAVCTRPLGDSPSDDYCGEHCQQVWLAAKAVPLPEHREVHTFAGVESRGFTRPPCWCDPDDPCTCQPPERVAAAGLAGGFMTPARLAVLAGLVLEEARRQRSGDPLAFIRITGV